MTTTTAAPAGAARLPRGVRNRNPGNLRHGNDWQGLSTVQADPAFCTFDDPVMGLRALMRVLLNYRRKHGLRTVRQAIARWAPPHENATAEYAAAVARRLGVDADSAVDWSEPGVLIAMARAIVTHENGRPHPEFPPDWYSADQYRRAAELALAA